MPLPSLVSSHSSFPLVEIREFDFSKFIQLWPAYLDSELSLAEGRRIAKEFCCQAPRVEEMSEICQMLKLRHVLEVLGLIPLPSASPLHLTSLQPFKRYPRSFWRPGRIRVQIVNPDGSYCNEDIKSSITPHPHHHTPHPFSLSHLSSENDLLKKMGTCIVKLNSRIQRLQAEAQLVEQQQSQQQQGAEGAKKNPKKSKKKGK